MIRSAFRIGMLALPVSAWAGIEANPSSSVYIQTGGGTQHLQSMGASALRDKAITNSYYRPSGGSGTVSYNVDMTSGLPVYSVPIGSISAAGEVAFPIALTYAGSIRQQFDSDNDRGPTSWIGLGWNFGTPFVAVNHQGTLTDADDVYFCSLGPYGGGQLLKNSAGTFFVATNPAIKVIPSTKDANGNIPDWEFRMPSGVKLAFGKNTDNNNAKRTILRTGGFLGASPYTAGSAVDFIYRWDLSSMSDHSGTRRLKFIYKRFQASFGSKSYTRESYIQDVIWANKDGDEIERYSFATGNKGAGEYVTGSSVETLNQKIYETQRLDKIRHYSEGVLDKTWTLTQPLMPTSVPGYTYPKMRLTKVQVEIPNPRGGSIVDPKMAWSFSYDETANHHSGLMTITKPGFGKDEFLYGRPDYSHSGWTPAIGQVQTKEVIDNLTFTSPPDLGIWSDQSFCTEKFCFVVVEKKLAAQGANAGEIRIEVFNGAGNRIAPAEVLFGSTPSVLSLFYASKYPGSFRLIPWNDNFLVVNTIEKWIKLFEWNGRHFIPTDIKPTRLRIGNPTPVVIQPIVDETNGIQVTTVGDRLLVHDYNYKESCTDAARAKSKVYMFSKVGSAWEEINKEECTLYAGSSPRNCPFNNNGDFGEPHKTPLNGISACMEFDSKPLLISAMPSMFHMVAAGDIIFTYVPNPAGTNFDLISSKYAYFGNPPQTSETYKSNWIYTILEPIQFGKDYFLIKSVKNSNARIDIMHYDGTDIRRVGGIADRPYVAGTNFPTSFQAFPSADYFVTTDQVSNKVEMYLKQLVGTAGAPTAINFQQSQVRQDPIMNGSADVLVRTAPYAFTIEYYPKGGTIGGVSHAAPLANGSNYHAYLYQIDPSFTAPGYVLFNPVGRFQDANLRNLYDVQFNVADNSLTAKSCWIGTNAICTPGAANVRKLYSALTISGQAGLGNKLIRKKGLVVSPLDFNSSNSDFKAIHMGPGLAAVTTLNTASQKAEYAVLKFMGEGYTQFPYDSIIAGNRSADYEVVKKFTSYSDIAGPVGGHKTEAHFFYPKGTLSALDQLPEFNSHLQQFIFPSSGVVEYRRKSDTQLDPGYGFAGTVFHHWEDQSTSPLEQDELMKTHLPSAQRHYKVNVSSGGTYSLGAMLSQTNMLYHPPVTNTAAGWPAYLKIVHPASQSTTTYADNGSSMTSYASQHCIYAPSGAPVYTLTTKDGNQYINQTLYDQASPTPAVPIGSKTFRNPGATLASLDACAFSESNAPAGSLIGSSKVGLGSDPWIFKPTYSYTWTDNDDTRTNEELKAGDDPIFIDFGSNAMRLSGMVVSRNAYGQPLIGRYFPGELVPLVETHSYYEGRASLPVASINVPGGGATAVLTCENGNVGGLGAFHDSQGRWKKADAGATTALARTGRYSIKVDNTDGPTIDLFLSSSLANDYVLSAWIYGDSAVAPALVAEAYKSGPATPAHTFPSVRAPVGEAFVRRKWQRYELRLTPAQLKGAQNVFSASGDFLRVKVGAAGTGTNTVYVDDIVCRPANATFSLTAYDGKGRPTAGTDNFHLTTYREYGETGAASAGRDDKYRIYTNSATHIPGEND